MIHNRKEIDVVLIIVRSFKKAYCRGGINVTTTHIFKVFFPCRSPYVNRYIYLYCMVKKYFYLYNNNKNFVLHTIRDIKLKTSIS